MIKKVVCLFLLALCISSLYAVSITSHIGLLSGLGVSKSIGKFNNGIDIESSFPGYALGDGLVCDTSEEFNFSQGFSSGAKYFIGLDLYSHFTIFKDNSFTAAVGLDMFSGYEIAIKTFDLVLKGSLVVSESFGENTSVFLNMNYPFVALTHVSGFKAPLIYIPDSNWLSVLTGWKLGISIDI